MCFKCGEESHILKGCNNKLMARWEQDVLRNLVMPNQDIDASPFPSNPSQGTSMTGGRDTPATASARSITYGIAGLELSTYLTPEVQDAKHAEAMLGKRSGPNKRAHREEPAIPATQSPAIP